MKNSRRIFLKNAGTGVLGLGLTSSLYPLTTLGSQSQKTVKDTYLFKIGMAGYPFIKFKIDPSLEMIERVDVHYLSIKDFHLPLDSTVEQIAEFHKKLKEKGVAGYAVGPINLRNESQVDRAFEYAKSVGVKMIVGVPSFLMLPYLDKKVKEYNISFAVHNHGPDDKLYPSLTSIYEKIKNLDSGIGMCHDIGYTTMLGLDPAAETIKYADRIYDVHLRDVTSATPEGKDCELGRGVIDFPSYVKALRKTKYKGMCSIEYEKVLEDPLAGIAESIGYIKGIMDALS